MFFVRTFELAVPSSGVSRKVRGNKLCRADRVRSSLVVSQFCLRDWLSRVNEEFLQFMVKRGDWESVFDGRIDTS